MRAAGHTDRPDHPAPGTSGLIEQANASRHRNATLLAAHQMDRRDLLGMLTIGIASALTGCSSPVSDPTPRHNTFPAPVPGPVRTFAKVPGHTRDLVLTIDDGADATTLAAYVNLAQTTGLHLTFNPNGMRAPIWNSHAKALAPMIEAGQVQIANHTYHHRPLVGLTDADARAELERNEDWIQATFNTSSRPYFRPPNGVGDHASNQLCGQLGYTKILLWDGSFGDAKLVSQATLLAAADKALRPAAIVVGHANAPTVTHLFPIILELIKSRNLTPVTLDEAFGTRRRTG